MRTAQYLFTLSFAFIVSVDSYAQREYCIDKQLSPPVIDGFLNEEAWKQTDIACDFTTKNPIYGNASEFKTEVHMYYDDYALYIGGEMYDVSPDSVSYSLSSRDNEGNGDWFGVSLDPYGNNVSAFTFMITAAGVELDAIETIDEFDVSWNAVIHSATAKTSTGWSFEIKIPYSSIRFPNKNIQEWNINFWRSVRRRREESTWNPIDPNVFGEITQSGRLTGIENIKPPLRLSFTPYATGYLENSFDEATQQQTWKSRATGGLDLKLGLNDAFTLDMTVIPDFGQTVSDRQVLNLGPFEIQYNENRPFFLEGTDLFKIGGVFYSRRIGAAPYNHDLPYGELNDSIGERVISNPSVAPMINGTKISGRTKNGLGIGVFNAIEGRTFAIISDSLGNERKVQTNSLTNYNVFVLSQNLKNNSVISLVNTNVVREGSNRDANVTVGSASIYTPNGKYRLSSDVRVSSVFEEEPTIGHALNSSISKVSGKWRYYFGYGEESDSYDPNDLGFLYNNNSRYYSGGLSWNNFKPSRYFYRRSASLSWTHEELYKPQRFSDNFISWNLGGLLKQQIYTNLSGNISPFGVVNHFESRHFGREVKFNPNASIRWLISSDYSKVIALDASLSYKQFFGVSQNGYGCFLSPRVRASDRMNFVWSSSVESLTNDYGYVKILDENFNNEIILGVRNRMIIENTLKTEFIFTNRMGIDLIFRHYWQQVKYDHFLELLDEGETRTTAYNPIQEDGSSAHNTSYNAFTVDVNYRWVFSPGSQLRIVYKNNIFNSKTSLDGNYFETFGPLFSQAQINSISMKLLVYIDAMYFRKKNKRESEKI